MTRLKVLSIAVFLLLAAVFVFVEQKLEMRGLTSSVAMERDLTLHQANDLRTHLVTHLSLNANILYGLRAFIEANPELSSDDFDLYAASIKRTQPSIRSIAGAPNMVVRFVYPMIGNEAALGLDYRTAPMAQRGGVFRAIREGKPVIAGPVELVQGGVALIFRLPVFRESAAGNTESWGILSALLEMDSFYKNVHLMDFTDDYDLSLRGHDGLGYEGNVFFGDAELFTEKAQSVLVDVPLENGSWVLAMKPKAGWSVQYENQLVLRLSFLAVFIVLTVTVLTLSGFLFQRSSAQNREMRAFREKSEFLEILSHEIRSPLQGVLGAQRYLLDNGIPNQFRSIVETAHQSGGYILQLINDYLDLQRAESNRLSANFAPANVRDVVKESFDIAAANRRNDALKACCEVAAAVPQFLMLDERKVRQVLINIIGNAVKFTRRGHVHVNVEYVNDEATPLLVITVKDTGIGIDKAELATLFDRFTRAKQGEAHSGSGLGLAIAKSVVEIMGGTLGVESDIGEGSCFTITLPVSGNISISEIPQQIDATSPFEASLEQKDLLADARVLVADDIIVNRILINAMLSPIVKHVTMVEDGKAVLEELGKNSYDIVIMDLNMPKVNGLQATQLIRALPELKNLSIIGLTGENSQERHDILLSGGMDVVLLKPITLAPLLESMSRLYAVKKTS